MKLKQLWEFSSKIHTEIFLSSRIQGAGNNKEIILDKYKEDLEGLKKNSRMSSIFMASILLFPAIIAISAIDESISRIPTGNLQQIFFTNSIAISTYYMFNALFILLFGLMTIASVLEGDVFKFLHTLPLSRNEIQIVGIITIFRILQYQLVIILFIFPLGILYITKDMMVFGIVFILNLINSTLILYTLIIIVDKMTEFLLNRDSKFGLNTFLRYIFLTIYMLGGFILYYFVGSLNSLISSLFVTNLIPQSVLIVLNQFLGLIAFPFSTSYVISLLTLRRFPTEFTLLSTITGTITLILITYLGIKKGNKILLNIPFRQSKKSTKMEKSEAKIQINNYGQFWGYFRLNFIIISREVSAMISLTMAIIFPILPVILGTTQDPWENFLFYSGFLIIFSNNAFQATEESVGGFLRSLPVTHLQLLRVKQILLALLFYLGYLTLNITTGFDTFSLQNVLLIFFLGLVLPNVFLLVKSRIFGKINNRYTLFDFQDNTSFTRNLVLLIPMYLIIGFEYIVIVAFSVIEGLYTTYLFLIGFNLSLMLILELLNRKMLGDRS